MEDNFKEVLLAQIKDYAVFYGLYRLALEDGSDAWQVLKGIHQEKLEKIANAIDDIVVSKRYDQLVVDVLNEFTVRRAGDEDFANEWPEDTFDAYFDQYKFDKINAAIVDKVHPGA